MRGKNLFKLLKAVDLISKPEGVAIDTLAEQLEISERSAYRMVNLLEELGFPLYTDESSLARRKRFKLEVSFLKKLPNMNIPDVSLTLSEIIALYLMKSEGKVYNGTDIEKALNSAFAKIGLLAPNGLFNKLNRIKSLFISSSKLTKDYSGKEDLIDFLTDAMLQKGTCRVRYHSFGKDETKEFKIDPLYFFENNGGLYLFVKTTDYGDIRILAIERILELEKTSDIFEYPSDFDPEEALDAAFGIVYDDPIHARIWFSADQAMYIKERRWAKDQKIIEQLDGSVILEMKTSGWWDVKRWVLSFGAEAAVLEPAKLRRDVMDELKSASRKYRGVLKGL